MGKGLYNQLQGNEYRQSSQVFDERLKDNHIVEGNEIATLKRMAKDKNWTSFNSFIEKLKLQGWNKSRIDSIVTCAMSGIRL